MIYLISLCISLSAAFLEAVSYFGFVANHFVLPSYFWHFLSIIIAVVTGKRLAPWAYRLLGLTVIVSLLADVIFTILEFLHYDNYVYSHFHVQIITLEIFVLLALFHYFFKYLASRSALIHFGSSLLIASLIFASSEGIGRTIAFFYKRYAVILAHPFDNYEQKMVRAYGEFYPAMHQVEALTPPNALILIPPQGNPWEIEGNAPMVTYYLYPRRVENMGTEIPQTDNPTYALIAHGSWPKTGDTDYGWPKVKVPSTRVWKFDLSAHQFEEFNKNFDPQTDQWNWGLIEVSHD